MAKNFVPIKQKWQPMERSEQEKPVQLSVGYCCLLLSVDSDCEGKRDKYIAKPHEMGFDCLRVATAADQSSKYSQQSDTVYCYYCEYATKTVNDNYTIELIRHESSSPSAEQIAFSAEKGSG